MMVFKKVFMFSSPFVSGLQSSRLALTPDKSKDDMTEEEASQRRENFDYKTKFGINQGTKIGDIKEFEKQPLTEQEAMEKKDMNSEMVSAVPVNSLSDLDEQLKIKSESNDDLGGDNI